MDRIGGIMLQFNQTEYYRTNNACAYPTDGAFGLAESNVGLGEANVVPPPTE
jgi:hypothetical protein